MSQYEIWCPSCDVSFPVGTKRCMHCGARTVKDRPGKNLGGAARFAMDSETPYFASSEDTHEEQLTHIGPGELAEAVDEEEAPRRGILRAGMSVLWMVLLAAGYIWQNCAGGPA